MSTAPGPQALPDVEDAPAFLRPRDVVFRYGVSDSTLRRWIEDGTVESVRVNRMVFIPVASLDRLFPSRDPPVSGGTFEDGMYVLSDREKIELREMVWALPKLSDEELDALADVLIANHMKAGAP